MPWQSDGCPLTGKHVVEEEKGGKGHMLDQCLFTGERTGQAVEVFFIHTLAKNKEKSLLISLHYPPPLALVRVIRMTVSFSNASLTHTHTNRLKHTCTHYSGVTGPWRYDYTLNIYVHVSYIHQHVTLKNYICVPFWSKHIVLPS